MSKYTPPAVTMLDVSKALRTLSMPLSLRVTIVPVPRSPDRVHACVELVYYGPRGEAYVYKRWGRDVRAADTLAVYRTLLVAAQESYLFLDGKDEGELARFVGWQLSLPEARG